MKEPLLVPAPYAACTLSRGGPVIYYIYTTLYLTTRRPYTYKIFTQKQPYTTSKDNFSVQKHDLEKPHSLYMNGLCLLLPTIHNIHPHTRHITKHLHPFILLLCFLPRFFRPCVPFLRGHCSSPPRRIRTTPVPLLWVHPSV